MRASIFACDLPRTRRSSEMQRPIRYANDDEDWNACTRSVQCKTTLAAKHNGSDNASVLLNEGAGGFSASTTSLGGGTAPTGIAVAA